MDHDFLPAFCKASAVAFLCVLLVGCQKQETFGETPASAAELVKAKAGWSPEMVEKFRNANYRAKHGLDETPEQAAVSTPKRSKSGNK